MFWANDGQKCCFRPQGRIYSLSVEPSLQKFQPDYAILQDDGVLAVKNKSGSSLWKSSIFGPCL
jgi:hypothetical protein